MAIEKKSPVYKVDGRVSIALDALDDNQKRIIGSIITDRDHFLQSTQDTRNVQRISNKRPLYSLKVPAGLRVIFWRKGEDIEVMDLMQQVTLNQFARKTSKTKNTRTTRPRSALQ